MALERLQFLAGCRLPQDCRFVSGAGDSQLAVCAEGHAEDGVAMSLVGVKFLARSRVPQHSRLVAGAGEEQLGIVAQSNAPDITGVLKGALLVTAGRLP